MHRSRTSPPALRHLMRAGGAVAVAAGLHTAISGGRSVPGHGRMAGAALESELRYYGVFYSAYGVALLRAAGRTKPDPGEVRALAATLFVAGLARLGGWPAAGRPSPAQLALLAIELAAPPLVVAWPSGRRAR